MTGHRLVLLLCAAALSGCAAVDVPWLRLGADPNAPRPAPACLAPSQTNPALAAPGGMGGTGAVAAAMPGEGGGIGGTGRSADAGPPGLGGTGIVGVVTGFASVCVNGVEVELQPDTQLRRDGVSVAPRELAVGQLVAIAATGSGRELTARRIEVIDTLVAPVETVDVARRELRALGQRVVLLSAVDAAGLQPGDWVRISGHRGPNDEVRASFLTRWMGPAPSAQVLGRLSRDAQGQVRVAGTRVMLAPGAALAQPGDEVLVAGRWDGQQLLASRVEVQPIRRAIGATTSQAVLQGYVQSRQGLVVQLGYEQVELQATTRVYGGTLESLQVGRPVQAKVRRSEEGRWLVEELYLGREGGRGARSSGERGDDGGGRRGRGSDGGGDDGGSSGSSGGDSGSSGSSGSSGGKGRGRGGK